MPATAPDFTATCTAWIVSSRATVFSNRFFPEAHLASCLQHSVYCILIHENPSVADLKECYRLMAAAEGPIDQLYLIDGGCDVLLTGAEPELGTPVEDMMHLQTIRHLDAVKDKYVMAVGVDVDCAHGVREQDLVARLDALAAHKLLEWRWSLDQPSVARRYRDVLSKCQPVNSIVQSRIVASCEGRRGLYTPAHLRARIGENKVALSARVCTAFVYPVRVVADAVLYLDQIQDSMTSDDVDALISRVHTSVWSGEGAESRTRQMLPSDPS